MSTVFYISLNTDSAEFHIYECCTHLILRGDETSLTGPYATYKDARKALMQELRHDKIRYLDRYKEILTDLRRYKRNHTDLM